MNNFQEKYPEAWVSKVSTNQALIESARLNPGIIVLLYH